MSITTILPSQISELSVEDDDSDVDEKAIEEQKKLLMLIEFLKVGAYFGQ